MIISCDKCNKKFEISDELIPDNGRLLQCGSCSYQWHYMPTSRIKLVNEIDSNESTKKIEKIDENDADNEIDHTNENITTKKKNISFINFLLVGIISFVAIVILVDTFKNQIAYVIPNISLYINELHEILRDIFLFIADLSK